MPRLSKAKKSACNKLILARVSAMGKRGLSSCSSNNNSDSGYDANDDPLQNFDDNVVQLWHKETLAVAPHNAGHHLRSVYQGNSRTSAGRKKLPKSSKNMLKSSREKTVYFGSSKLH